MTDSPSLLRRFVIAHELATIQNADRLVVIDETGIVEDRSHRALLAREGAYANLNRAQFPAVESP